MIHRPSLDDVPNVLGVVVPSISLSSWMIGTDQHREVEARITPHGDEERFLDSRHLHRRIQYLRFLDKVKFRAPTLACAPDPHFADRSIQGCFGLALQSTDPALQV